MSLRAIWERLRTEELSPLEAVEICLRRIEQRDVEVRAWACAAAAGARRQAEALERSGAGSAAPLYGVPFGVKDIFDAAGLPAEWGSPLYRGRVPDQDAALVARLKRAGAIVLGKTHTTAFASFDPAPTRNPWNLEHTPGGSSSGSAAAVADGMVPFALGSQTMGSVLRPASFCGVAGFKPTFGRLETEGVLAFAPTLDHAGFFAPTAADIAFLWSAIEEEVPSQADVNRLAAGPWPLDGVLDPEMSEELESSLGRLGYTGCKIERIAWPESFRRLPAANRTVFEYEGARTNQERFERHGAAIGENLAALVERGLGISDREYQEALAQLDVCRAEFAALSERHPLFALPAALGPAPRGLESTGDPAANAAVTALGAPAISIPMPRSAAEAPLGLQLVAARGADAPLLAAAAAVERKLAEP